MSVKKLQVVDSSEFEKLIKSLRKTHEEDTVLNKATSEPENFSFLEAEKTLREGVAKNSPLTPLNKEQFLKTKNAYVKSLEKEKVEAQNQDQGDATKPGSKAHATKELLKFFKSHQITKATSGKLRLKHQEKNISYDDLVTDLTTDNRKKKTNLNNSELDIALSELHELGLPTSLIRSGVLKAKYKKIKEQSANLPQQQEASTSQVQQKVTPKKKEEKESLKDSVLILSKLLGKPK